VKSRRIYYRRKGDKIIAEGTQNNKTVYLFQIPSPEKLLIPSLFPEEKIAKIKEKISRLDIKENKVTESSSKVPPNKIKRTFQKDGEYPKNINLHSCS